MGILVFCQNIFLFFPLFYLSTLEKTCWIKKNGYLIDEEKEENIDKNELNRKTMV